MTALADLLIGDSVLLLYLSESRTRSQNSTIVPIFQNLLLFVAVFVLMYKSKSFLSIVAMMVRMKQDDNCFKALAS